MALNKQTIINNSKKVYACMYQMVHYIYIQRTAKDLSIGEYRIMPGVGPTDTGKQNQTRQKRARNLLRFKRLTIDKRF
mgnify:CR=1 FL=1